MGGGRGETGKANAITLGLGAGNWEGPASCWLLLTWIPWPPRGGLAAHGGGHHNRASFISPPLRWDCRGHREHRDLVQGGAWFPVVPWQEPPLSARHCRAALYGAMENIAGSTSSKGAGVVPLAFFK